MVLSDPSSWKCGECAVMLMPMTLEIPKLLHYTRSEEQETGGTLNSKAENDDNKYDSGNSDFDKPGNAFMDKVLPPCSKEAGEYPECPSPSTPLQNPQEKKQQ